MRGRLAGISLPGLYDPVPRYGDIIVPKYILIERIEKHHRGREREVESTGTVSKRESNISYNVSVL